MLPTYLRAFVDMFTAWFCKLVIPDGWRNSFWHNPRVCVEVILKKMSPRFISLMTVDGSCQQKVHYLNLINACFSCKAQDHLIQYCPLWKPPMRPLHSTSDGATSTLISTNDKVGSIAGIDWEDKERNSSFP